MPSHLGDCAPPPDAELRDREVGEEEGEGIIRISVINNSSPPQVTGVHARTSQRGTSPAHIRLIIFLNISPGSWKDSHSSSPEEAHVGFA